MKKVIVVFPALLLFSACYSFRGISIDPNDQTFFVQTFENVAPNAPPTYAIDFTEQFKQKVRTETRLRLQQESPDLEFSGQVTGFNVVPIAPKPGEVVARNRLEIRLRVSLTYKDEKRNWPNPRDFSYFAEFGNDQDLLTIQDQLIREINPQLLEDVFNAAFNNW
ncbi:MAG: hypothetical protein JNL02_12700 [Saprospiraceae bacterium]|nr:hypothetical protein [Saprospiraceae bacterium]